MTRAITETDRLAQATLRRFFDKLEENGRVRGLVVSRGAGLILGLVLGRIVVM